MPLAPYLLWRHVGRCADQGAGLGQVVVTVDKHGQAEVDELRAVRAENDVVWFEVAMQQARLVHLGQTVGEHRPDHGSQR